MTKIIALDIDGVLNHAGWWVPSAGLDPEQFYRAQFDPAAVRRLNAIVKATGAEIVLSSSWRHGHTIEEVQSYLDHHGFTGKLIDTTALSPTNCASRGEEIALWLAEADCEGRCVILDDSDDMLPEQLPYFVHTSYETGLTDADVVRAIQILNADDGAE